MVLFFGLESYSQDSLRPLLPQDFGQWETLGFGGILSEDGNWLAYSIRRNNDKNEVRLHNLENGDTKILEQATDFQISKNNVWFGYLINLPAEEKKKLEEAKKPVHTDFGLINLSNGDSLVIESVSSFSFSIDGNFIVLKRYVQKSVKNGGVEIIVRNLSTEANLSFGNVSEFKWQDEGPLLAMLIKTPGKTGNGVQLYNSTNGTLQLLDGRESVYKGLSWRKKSDDLSGIPISTSRRL